MTVDNYGRENWGGARRLRLVKAVDKLNKKLLTGRLERERQNRLNAYLEKKERNQMSKAMSNDRVHFTVTAQRLEKQEIRDCIEETLGIYPNQLPKATKQWESEYSDLHVICRPSQFARFVILRHVKYGQQNNMACLNMKLVKPEPVTATPMDVSKNPDTSSGAP